MKEDGYTCEHKKKLAHACAISYAVAQARNSRKIFTPQRHTLVCVPDVVTVV